MSTKIEWTRGDDGAAGETWNPTLGCERVSKGCDGCYAVRTATIRAGNPHPAIAAAYAGLTHRTDTGLDWTGVVRTLPERLTMPLHWRKPRRIFVDSQSDLFHKDVQDEFIAQVFAVMAATPHHTYQLLTKRHGRMRSLLNSPDFRRAVADELGGMDVPFDRIRAAQWPLSNVWLGVSVEDQKAADLRIPALLSTPAAVRWLSCEPLLGPVNLFGYRNGLDWVVAGGESGPGARPMHPDWARQLRDDCQAAGVPFFFKQWGEWAPAPWVVRVCDPTEGWKGTDEELSAAKAAAEAVGATVAVQLDGHVYRPPHKCWSLERNGETAGAMRKAGKKAAGRELDGRTWDEFPRPLAA